MAIQIMNVRIFRLIFLCSLIVTLTLKKLAANVCVCGGLGFQSRVLSHETKRLNEVKTLIQLVTAPLQKHFVAGWPFFPP